MSNREANQWMAACIISVAAYIFVTTFAILEQAAEIARHRIECHRIIRQTDERIPESCFSHTRRK